MISFVNFFVTVSMLFSVSTALPCSLCGDSTATLPSNWDAVVAGQSCTQHYIGASKFNLGSQQCIDIKAQAESICCTVGATLTAATPLPTDVAPTTYAGVDGNEKVCSLCTNLEYPGLNSQMLNVRYVGSYSCDQLYHRGIHKQIPEFMCGPLQDYARDICGCGFFNPGCESDPNLCYGQPGNPVGSQPALNTSAGTTTAAPAPSPVPAQPPASNTKQSIGSGSGGAAGGNRRLRSQ